VWFACQDDSFPTELHVGGSDKQEKCVIPDSKRLKCDANAANPGIRRGGDPHKDTFMVSNTPSTGEICVKRVDKKEGWGLDLRIVCKHDFQGVEKATARVTETKQLVSYWDDGSCGYMGDDFQGAWCGWDRAKNCDINAHLTVNAAKKYCRDGKLKVTWSGGNGWFSKHWHHGCSYLFIAWFTCQQGGMPQELHVGSSFKIKKCVTPEDEKKNKKFLTCEENAANQGFRLGWDNHGDKFKVTPGSNGEICVERVDDKNGWSMDLKIVCHLKSAGR